MAKKTETRPATAAINPFGLRMQPELREQLESAASLSGRSLNAEIVHRLEVSFSVDKQNAFDLLKKALDTIQATERSIADFDRDIAALEAGEAGALEWLIDRGDRGARMTDAEAIESARHIQSIIKKELEQVRGYVPTLVAAVKEGGPVPTEIERFLRRA